jgi:hypothetical protein
MMRWRRRFFLADGALSVMAGLVPAIYVVAPSPTVEGQFDRVCDTLTVRSLSGVDARDEPGHDDRDA